MKFLHIRDIDNPLHNTWAECLTLRMGKKYACVNADDLKELRDPDHFSEWLQEQNVDLIFISCENDSRVIQGFLNATRSLRIPYVFLTDTMQKMDILAHADTAIRIILAPVTMLEEEVYKAEIIGHLMRFTGCSTTLLQAHDYGHRAQQNVGRIRTFLKHEGHEVTVLPAKKDSMSLHKELPDLQTPVGPDLLLLTASREYGLDDLIFGPAERSAIRKAAVPVMLLNPRGDLFSLCD